MLQLIGFDGDDTLWHSEGYYQQAQAEFAAIVGRHVDLADHRLHDHMLATERRNLQLFGYGAKGMTLSMVETAIAITDGRITAAQIHQLVQIGKRVLQHPVELLPGIRAAVEAVAEQYAVVLITKGDLFHQEKKVAQSGLAGLFRRIEMRVGERRRQLPSRAGRVRAAAGAVRDGRQLAALGHRAGAAPRRLGRAPALSRDLGARAGERPGR